MESYCIQPESQYMYMGTVTCGSLCCCACQTSPPVKLVKLELAIGVGIRMC